jgi:hypothetical protein
MHITFEIQLMCPFLKYCRERTLRGEVTKLKIAHTRTVVSVIV